MEDFMDYTLNLDNSEIYLLMRRLGYNDNEIDELRKTLGFKKELGPTARREIKINPFYRVLPYGACDGKIFIPEQYEFIKDVQGVPDVETMYNISMITRNFYFWFLLDPIQRKLVYEALKKYNKKRVIGYHDKTADFGYIFDKLVTQIPQFGSNSIDMCIVQDKVDHLDINDDIRKLCNLNLEHIIKIIDEIREVSDKMDSELIASSLHFYKPFVWFLVKDRVTPIWIDGAEFFINGLPEPKGLYRKEYSR